MLHLLLAVGGSCLVLGALICARPEPEPPDAPDGGRREDRT